MLFRENDIDYSLDEDEASGLTARMDRHGASDAINLNRPASSGEILRLRVFHLRR